MRHDEVLATRGSAELVCGRPDRSRGGLHGHRRHRSPPPRPVNARQRHSRRHRGSIYRGLRRGADATARGAPADRPDTAGDAPEVSTLPRGSLALGVLNGLRGTTGADESTLAIPLAHPCRRTERRADPLGAQGHVPPTRPEDRDLRPRPLQERTPRGASANPALRPRCDGTRYTPVVLATTAACTSPTTAAGSPGCFEELYEAWPELVEEITLIGHSIGGLIFRSACHYAVDSGQHSVRDVRHVFYSVPPTSARPSSAPSTQRRGRWRRLPRHVGSAASEAAQRRPPRPAPRLLCRRGVGQARPGRGLRVGLSPAPLLEARPLALSGSLAEQPASSSATGSSAPQALTAGAWAPARSGDKRGTSTESPLRAPRQP